MNPEKPPAYFESNEVPYQPLQNNSFSPTGPQQPYSQPMPYAPNQFPPVNPYGNMAPNPNQFVFATTIQQPPVAPAATTVNVNTGPIQKRYCCSCCCTLFWIIVVVLIIAGISNSVH